MSGWIGRLFQPAEVTFVHEFHRPPYGGGNQFLLALRSELQRRGIKVAANRVSRTTRVCLFNSFNFDFEELRRNHRPGCRMVHRVDGPIGAYRGADDGTDVRIARVNQELADATIFQSRYSQQAHEAAGLHLTNPTVILNTADPRIFHPGPARAPLAGRKVRLISSSWSDNPNKGAAAYQWLDQHLDWDRFEYTFVGRSQLRFEHIRMVPPVGSEELATLLRRHDVYVTASLHDPCSNALLEALSCGLPAIYANSGGHPEIVGQAGLGFSAVDEVPELVERLCGEYEAYHAAIAVPTLAETADAYLAVMGLRDEPRR